MNIDLYPHQIKAVEQLHNGAILVGGVGTGKSRTALAYFYFKICGGKMKINGEGHSIPMKTPMDIYIITTAKKRDSKEWEDECASFGIMPDSKWNEFNIKLTVDSWNNIKRYVDVKGAFFIFDEQRVVGYGAWTKAFLKIAKSNQWILLSATPGDTWSDYIPVFIANGFYRNKTDFNYRHVKFSRFSKYPKVEKYLDIDILNAHRRAILVMMRFEKKATPINIDIPVEYNKAKYLTVWRERWDPYEQEPIPETGKLFYLMRRVVNEDKSRGAAVLDILSKHHSAIVFYNFTYELEYLRLIFDEQKITYAEWNGQKHEAIPAYGSGRWVYLVQYSAGSEGWNCIDTNVIIFYSLNYSYRMMVQAAGRIDRLNTPYDELYYYRLKSFAPIDIAIARALKQKKNFNERSFIG